MAVSWSDFYTRRNRQALSRKYRSELPGAPAPLNQAQSRLFAQAYLTAFPDAHLEVTLLIAQGTDAVMYWTGTGTQTGLTQHGR